MPDLPDSTSLIGGIVALAMIPVIVALRGRQKIKAAIPPRAEVDPELREPIHDNDDWSGIDAARRKPGAPQPGPRPYDWRHRVPAMLLEPGRRPRSGRC